MQRRTQTYQSVDFLVQTEHSVEFLGCERSLRVPDIAVQTTVSSCLICVLFSQTCFRGIYNPCEVVL